VGQQFCFIIILTIIASRKNITGYLFYRYVVKNHQKTADTISSYM